MTIHALHCSILPVANLTYYGESRVSVYSIMLVGVEADSKEIFLIHPDEYVMASCQLTPPPPTMIMKR